MCGTGVLERFVGLCGRDQARITLVTTATGIPDEVHAEYEQVFRKLGVEQTQELRLRGRVRRLGRRRPSAARLDRGVLQRRGSIPDPRAGRLQGQRHPARQLGHGLVVAGTSAGATAMGRTMILGGEGPDVSAATVRTGPGLGLAPRMLIDMHFARAWPLPRLLSAVALDPEHLGVGIDENTAILVEGNRFEVLGTGVATVADGERSTVVHAAGDCDPITLFDVRLHLMPAGCVFDIAPRAPHRARAQPLLSQPPGNQPGPAATTPMRIDQGAPVRLTEMPPPVRPEHLHVPPGHHGPAGAGRADRAGDRGRPRIRRAADRGAARAGRAPLRGRAARRLPRRAGPRHLLRPRHRARGARTVRAWPAATCTSAGPSGPAPRAAMT